MSRLPDSLRTGSTPAYGPSYTNGYTPQPDEPSTSRPAFRPRERRAGGYGADSYAGYADDARSDPRGEPRSVAGNSAVAAVTRPTSLERSQAKRRSTGAGLAQRSPTRRGAGGAGDGSKQMEAVIRDIQHEWGVMTGEECVPVQVALQLLDESSLGLAGRYEGFRARQRELQSALRVIVNEHHQGFNSSIGTFHSIQAAIQMSQVRLRALRAGLGQAKTALAASKPELQELAVSSRNYDDMLQVLAAIENLQGIPEKLEARISEKRFLSAVELLQDALLSIRKAEMDKIGALGDLKVYLSNQEHSLGDILREELHNHLYLKSPYCENRWKEYATHAKNAEVQPNGLDTRGRLLYQFLDKLDTSKPIQDDPTRNPEAESFAYIQLLVESLHSLNQLDVAVETINQRLPMELFRIVEKTSAEVDQRHPSSLRGMKDNMGSIDTDNGPRATVLNDLFGTLYARFEAIAEGHRVVHEVISGIIKREGLRGSMSLTGGFRELWKLYQSEIRSLLHDYLATDGENFRGGPGEKAGSVFQRNRDKNKKLFKLADLDPKSADLESERDALEQILKSSVPGLVSDSKRPAEVQTSTANAYDGSATGHKLLVEPSVFNMGILLPPSLKFLNRLKEVVPPTSDIALSTLTSFLDDFLINVFLPQLEETLMELSAQTFIESDAFQADPKWATLAKKPIFKGTGKFFTLITAFCKMLCNLPHDQAFSQLVINQMVTYYDKCYGWFRALVSRLVPHPQTGKRLKFAAMLDDEDQVQELLRALANADKGSAGELLEQETKLLIQATSDVTIDEIDVISDQRTMAALCLMYTSMKWLASKIARMRHISPQSIDSSRRESRYTFQRRWTLVPSAEKSTEEGIAFLPLNQDSAVAFDGVVSSYQQLAAKVLRMLHLETRAHVFFHIKRSMSRTFRLEQRLQEPDPEISALNADMITFDEVFATHLQAPQQAFIITGLAHLLDHLFIHAASNISIMNENGCARVQLNILVVQHNLKNVEPDALLMRSKAYFELFAAGPAAVVAAARERNFDQGQLRTLLALCYSENMASERRELAVQAKRGLDEHTAQLAEAYGASS
ncbi:hypothetical protein EJ06DRAFT_553480 [Trichodelitschia bisporula]|uniref:Exocyst complex component Sec8 n=1 Tax=Trichodelitschia bisporula TaxID=703511 RepID=A0A6G1I8N9_9PEZI|nr:hypothetical protein EJ06DRAFT_553480 [Trichodelitschia bisporula]